MKRANAKGPDAQFKLNFSSDLRKRIALAAKLNDRSMNSEIVRALKEAYPDPVTQEPINEALLEASQAVLCDWVRMGELLGLDPTSNPRTKALIDVIEVAKKQAGRG